MNVLVFLDKKSYHRKSTKKLFKNPPVFVLTMFVEHDNAEHSGVSLQPLQRLLQLNIVLDRIEDMNVFWWKLNPVFKMI